MSHLLTIIGSRQLVESAADEIDMFVEGTPMFLENDEEVFKTPDLLAIYGGEMEGPHKMGSIDTYGLTALIKDGVYVELDRTKEGTYVNLSTVGRWPRLLPGIPSGLKRPIKEAISISGIPVLSINKLPHNSNQRQRAIRYFTSNFSSNMDKRLVKRMAEKLREQYSSAVNNNL